MVKEGDHFISKLSESASLLVVCAFPADAKTITDILSPNYDIVAVSSKRQAFSELKKKIDLIITEALAGDERGLAFLDQLKNRPELSSIPVIAITNGTDSEHEVKA